MWTGKPTKKQLSVIFVILLFATLFLSVHGGKRWNYKLNHEYPYNFNANDNFLHSEFSDFVKLRGSYDLSPFYIYAGYTDVIGYIPPILYHLSAELSLLTGLETYNTTYIIVLVLMTCAALLIFFSIKRVNEKLAILSLPFMIGIFAMSFEIPYAWGLWIFLVGAAFLFSVIWYLSTEKPECSFLIFALLLSGCALAHTSELIFSAILLLLYFVFYYFYKSLDKKEIKLIVLGLVVFSVISFYYLTIFYFTYITTSQIPIVMERPIFAPNFPVTLETFGHLQYLLILGFLVTLILFISREELKKIINHQKIPFIHQLYTVWCKGISVKNHMAYSIICNNGFTYLCISCICQTRQNEVYYSCFNYTYVNIFKYIFYCTDGNRDDG